jgi:uncharacterized membrane protein (Fun14 family)
MISLSRMLCIVLFLIHQRNSYAILLYIIQYFLPTVVGLSHFGIITICIRQLRQLCKANKH